MVEIRIVTQSCEWNQFLTNFECFDVFSSFEWGEYKKAQGWKVERIVFLRQNQLIGACQFLFKTKFKVMLGWNSGGILFSHPKDLQEISEAIREHYKNFIFSHRFNFYQKRSATASFYLSQSFAYTNSNINSPFSIIFDLSQTYKMSSNHRYYLKQSLKHELVASFQTNSQQALEDFWKTYNQMTINKHLENIQLSQAQLTLLSNIFGKYITIGNIYHNQTPICSCILLTCNDCAFYYLASSNEDGRKLYASYFMIDELLKFLKNQNFRLLNFGGITPFDINAFGVNRFKMGFGGEIIEYLGERELYNSSMLNRFFNHFIIGRKK